MIEFRELLEEDVTTLQKLSEKLLESVKNFDDSSNASPFDIRDISRDFDSVLDIVKELKDYFEYIDKEYPSHEEQLKLEVDEE